MPDQYPQIIPMLSYKDGLAAMDWLCKAFGFIERMRILDEDGGLAHGELALGDGVVMLASPSPDYEGPSLHRQTCAAADKWLQVPWIVNGVLVHVPDIYQHFSHAKEFGVMLLSELQNTPHGRLYRAEDLEGQRWMFMQME